MSAVPDSLQFVYTWLFERTARGLLTDREMQAVEQHLLRNPRAGDSLSATGGVRKIRAGLPGRGKRGGARVLYYYIELRSKVYFLLAFAKNVQANLTSDHKKSLRQLVRQLEGEE